MKTVNKTLNTVLFILGATVAIIMIWLVLMFIPMIIVVLINKNIFNNSTTAVMYFYYIHPLLAIIATFFLYSTILNKISEKINMKEYFHPIIKKWDK